VVDRLANVPQVIANGLGKGGVRSDREGRYGGDVEGHEIGHGEARIGAADIGDEGAGRDLVRVAHVSLAHRGQDHRRRW
jgi:hypothetical protein